MSKFIDVSSYNNIKSYASINEVGLKGVIIKASEGTTFTDETFESKYYHLSLCNVNVGFYHYLTDTSEPETQAQHFYSLIKDKVAQIRPVLDVEKESLRENAEEYSERFISEFESLCNQKLLIYSGRCYIEDNFSTSFCNSHDFWVADYDANDVPQIDKCRKIVAWQYTEKCRLYEFVDGNLDCSELLLEDDFYNYENEEVLPYSDTSENYRIDVLQQELNEQGFTDYNGNMLVVDGIAGELTLSACPLVRYGARGNITKWIQVRLSIANDGIFGEDTRQKIIEFQENMSLNGDGIVGKNTWSKLIGL